MTKQEFEDLIFDGGFRYAVGELARECEDICLEDYVQSYLIGLMHDEKAKVERADYMKDFREAYESAGVSKYWVFNPKKDANALPKPIKGRADVEQFLD